MVLTRSLKKAQSAPRHRVSQSTGDSPCKVSRDSTVITATPEVGLPQSTRAVKPSSFFTAASRLGAPQDSSAAESSSRFIAASHRGAPQGSSATELCFHFTAADRLGTPQGSSAVEPSFHFYSATRLGAPQGSSAVEPSSHFSAATRLGAPQGSNAVEPSSHFYAATRLGAPQGFSAVKPSSHFSAGTRLGAPQGSSAVEPSSHFSAATRLGAPQGSSVVEPSSHFYAATRLGAPQGFSAVKLSSHFSAATRLGAPQGSSAVEPSSHFSAETHLGAPQGFSAVKPSSYFSAATRPRAPQGSSIAEPSSHFNAASRLGTPQGSSAVEPYSHLVTASHPGMPTPAHAGPAFHATDTSTCFKRVQAMHPASSAATPLQQHPHMPPSVSFSVSPATDVAAPAYGALRSDLHSKKPTSTTSALRRRLSNRERERLRLEEVIALAEMQASRARLALLYEEDASRKEFSEEDITVPQHVETCFQSQEIVATEIESLPESSELPPLPSVHQPQNPDAPSKTAVAPAKPHREPAFAPLVAATIALAPVPVQPDLSVSQEGNSDPRNYEDLPFFDGSHENYVTSETADSVKNYNLKTDTTTGEEVTPTSSTEFPAACLKIAPDTSSIPAGAAATSALRDYGPTVSLLGNESANQINSPGITDMKVDAARSRRVTITLQGRDTEEQLKREHIIDKLHLTPTEMRMRHHGQPIALLTPLGCVANDTHTRSGHQVNFMAQIADSTAEERVDDALCHNLALESLAVSSKNPRSDPDQQALEILERPTRQLPDRRYETALLRKKNREKRPEDSEAAQNRFVSASVKNTVLAATKEPRQSTDEDKNVFVRYEDPKMLAPNNFLLGDPTHVLSPGPFNAKDLIRCVHWHAVHRLADLFWHRWLQKYLPELNTGGSPTVADPLSRSATL